MKQSETLTKLEKLTNAKHETYVFTAERTKVSNDLKGTLRKLQRMKTTDT